MKVISIAGPYRSQDGEWQVRQNIRRAEEAAAFVWQNGGVALCPHKNTAGFGGLPRCSDMVFLAGDLELLGRCDAIWAIDGWRKSRGARGEVQYANAKGLSVLHTVQEVMDYLAEVSADNAD
jgi:hypothetical protein